MKGNNGSNNEEGAPTVFNLSEVRKKGNSLDSFSQTHFICQDSVDSLIVEVVKPLQTLKLIGFEVSSEHLGRFHSDRERSGVLELVVVEVLLVD